MGFKEAEGLFHQIIIRAVPWVPQAWKSKATARKIKSLSLYLSAQTVSPIPTVCLLFIYETQKYGCYRAVDAGGPHLAMDACLRL